MRNDTRNLSVALFMLAAGAASGQGIITRLAGTASAACGTSLDGIPATSVQLCNAQMPVVDGLGNVYFYDANHRIRQVAPNGIITTIAGNGTQGTAGDGGPALSANLGFIGQLAWSSAPVAWNGGALPCWGSCASGTSRRIRSGASRWTRERSTGMGRD